MDAATRDAHARCVKGFEIHKPSGAESPLIVEVPHAGMWLEPAAARWMKAPARMLAHDADLYVDELFADAVTAGATMLVAHVNRHVIDLNTAPREDYGGVEPGEAEPREVWHRAANGERVIDFEPPWSERARRWRRFYVPYHTALEALIEAKRAKFGTVVLLSTHSFAPPLGGRQIADVVIGSQQGATAKRELTEAAAAAAKERSLSVAHDTPFSGGYATMRYGAPERGVHAIQIELARALYMNGESLLPTEAFGEVRELARDMASSITSLMAW